MNAQDLALSQLHVRRLLDICQRRLPRKDAQPRAAPTWPGTAELEAAFAQALRYLIVHSREALVGLDLRGATDAVEATEHMHVRAQRSAIVSSPYHFARVPSQDAHLYWRMVSWSNFIAVAFRPWCSLLQRNHIS